MLCYFPVDARVLATEKAIVEGQTGVLGSIGRILAEGRTARAGAAGTPAQEEIPAQTGRRTQAKGCAHGVRSDRVCTAHGLPVEGAAQGTLRQRECNPQTLPGVGERWILPHLVASGACRVRRHGGHRLALAKRGWGFGESPAGARICRAKPHGSGEKMGASGCCWSTRVASRCRSS